MQSLPPSPLSSPSPSPLPSTSPTTPSTASTGSTFATRRWKIVHLSDIHFWRIQFKLRHLLNKRAWGTIGLLTGRARMFRLERAPELVDKVLSLNPDHVLITGDLTTTALEEEFFDARVGLNKLLRETSKATIIPGNHDRYTRESLSTERFEKTFGMYAPEPRFPWLRWLDSDTAILGLDPCRPDLTAQGLLPEDQLIKAQALLKDAQNSLRRLIVACHYPLAAPPIYSHELRPKRMINANEVGKWLNAAGPHIFCCGHVHVAWAYQPPLCPDQICLNSGSPLLRDPEGYRPPGFLEIDLIDDGVFVTHHAWSRKKWVQTSLFANPHFFNNNSPLYQH